MRLRAEDLGWRVGQRSIVSGINVEVGGPGLTTVVGPNGSGKTTLLHLLAGLRPATSGDVCLDGTLIRRIGSRERATKLALVEQHPHTGWELQVREVVALGRIPHTRRWGSAPHADTALLIEAMTATGVLPLADRMWQTLSGGERQRTQLARALVQQPELLLLDEPTNHLDLKHQLELLTIIAAQATASVAVLHDLDLAAAFADRVIMMHQGQVVADGPAEQVLTPELIAQVFGVTVEVWRSDRLRVSWSKTDPAAG
ncbi:MAG: ABC transporter ATP-binding protein [Arachnia sp.]